MLARRGLEKRASLTETPCTINQLLRHHVWCASTHVARMYWRIQTRLVHINRDCQPHIETSIGVAPQGKSDASQVGIQHVPEPVTTRHRVRRWWNNFTRYVGDKTSVKITNMWQRCRENTNGKRDLYLRNTRQTRLQKNGAHEKRQLGHKKLCKKQHGLCSRGARCADNQRGERCCAHASMRC